MQTPAGPSVDPALRLTDSLAVLLRARMIYPSGHGRVVAAAESLRCALHEHHGAGEIVVSLLGRHASIDGVEVRAGSVPTQWLSKACRRAGIGGVAVARDADVDALQRFAEHFATSGAGRGKALAPLPTDDGAGIRPLPLRLVGHHAADGDATPADAPLDVRVANDPAVRRRISELQAALDAANDHTGPSDELDVLPRILDAALADVGMDPSRAQEVVAEVLDVLARELPNLVSGGTCSIDTELARVARDVAHRVFGRNSTDACPDPKDELPTGRPEDEGVEADLPELLDELESLPETPGRATFEPETEVRHHTAEILVHLAIHAKSDDARAKAIAGLRASASPHPDIRLRTLDHALADSEPDATIALHCALIDAGLAHLVLRCPALRAEHLAAVFPRGFAELLAEPDATAARRLSDVLPLVPPERLRGGVGRALDDPALAERIARLLAIDEGPLLPTLAGAVDDQDRRLLPVLVQALRRRDLPPAAAAALRTVPLERLTPDYVRDLCALCQATGVHAESLAHRVCVESGHLVRRFVKAAAGDPALLDRRVAAIRALSFFPTLETRHLLGELARGWALGSRASRAVRDAATAALRSMERGPCA